MPETLYRLTYEATIDDAVDVSLRLANRTKAFRHQVRLNVIIAGVVGGGAFIGVYLFFNAVSTVTGAVLLFVAGLVFGVAVAFLFGSFFEKEIRKQHRKVLLEHFGGKTVIPTELEMRPDAVWVRQLGMEMLFPWNVCTGVLDNPDDIQIDFKPGITIVRNRQFTSAAERQTFLDTAQRLARSG